MFASLPVPLPTSPNQATTKNLKPLEKKMNKFLAQYPRPPLLLADANEQKQEWVIEIVATPQQGNFDDCGIFTIMCVILQCFACVVYVETPSYHVHNDFKSIQWHHL
jgi:Ulp1 family protease